MSSIDAVEKLSQYPLRPLTKEEHRRLQLLFQVPISAGANDAARIFAVTLPGAACVRYFDYDQIQARSVKEPAPSSLALLTQQLVHAVEALHQKPEEKKDTPMCPKCKVRHRVYDGAGRLTSYCLECKHAIDKVRYKKMAKAISIRNTVGRSGVFEGVVAPREGFTHNYLSDDVLVRLVYKK